jgi:hypothetical protein
MKWLIVFWPASERVDVRSTVGVPLGCPAVESNSPGERRRACGSIRGTFMAVYIRWWLPLYETVVFGLVWGNLGGVGCQLLYRPHLWSMH